MPSTDSIVLAGLVTVWATAIYIGWNIKPLPVQYRSVPRAKMWTKKDLDL